MTQPETINNRTEPAPKVAYDFDEVGGFWLVTCEDEHFVSTGLERAKAHARAIFGYCKDDLVTVAPAIDHLIDKAREAPEHQKAAALAKLVDTVYLTELPLGVHDIVALVGCEPEAVQACFNARCASTTTETNRQGGK